MLRAELVMICFALIRTYGEEGKRIFDKLTQILLNL